MIVVLAVDPSFGGSYNVKKALSEIDETILICISGDKWRRRPKDTIDYLITSGNVARCAKLVRCSRFVFLVGGSAVGVLGKLPRLKKWVRKLNLAVWFTDSYYRENPGRTTRLLESWGCKRYFFLDDAMTIGKPLGSIPLMQPVSLAYEAVKPETLTVMHSPGTKAKRRQKGSDCIERVVRKLKGCGYEFDYDCLMKLSHEDCLRRKAQAHIFIDKLPTEYNATLGKSGLEAMASGAVVVSALNERRCTDAYFKYPPVFRVMDEASLEGVLVRLLTQTHERLQELGQESRAWIEKYWGLENGAWLNYFRGYVGL